jgi:GNAT superfamily N-acetyltransferase
VDKCFDVYNSAWEKNWGFFPMTKEEFTFAAKDMKMILDPRMAFMAEVDGKAAGFMLAIPDFNYIFKRIPNGKLFPTGIFKLLIGKKLLKTVRIITLGVKPEFRGTGIFALFTYEAFERAKKFGYVAGEASWILEDNAAMNKPWQDLGAPLYRRWRIYEKAI